jgi:predicted aspartyl protease
VPLLTGRFSGQGQTPNGSLVAVPPAFGLAHYGPRLQITVGLAQPIAEELQKAGKPVPEPISGQALIDTGASATCIDDEAARKMQLPVIGRVTMASATHESIEKNVYPIHIQVIGANIAFGVAGAAGVDLKAQDLLALIGRDVLSQAILVYNGADGTFAFAL